MPAEDRGSAVFGRVTTVGCDDGLEALGRASEIEVRDRQSRDSNQGVENSGWACNPADRSKSTVFLVR